MEDSVMQIEHLADGTDYQVYIPENVTSETKIIVYDAGEGYYNDWKPVEAALTSEGCDAIVLRACYEDDWRTDRTLDALNDLITRYSDIGISSDNVVSCGHSMGGAIGTLRALNVIQQDSNVGPQMIVTLDGFFGGRPLLPNELELLKQNNSIMLAYYHPGYEQEYNYKKYAKSGVNVFLIKDLESGKPRDFWEQHAAANRDFFANGLLNYVAGTSTMPVEGYECLVYNKETDTFEPLNIENINTLYKLYDYCGVDNYQNMVTRLLSLDVQNATSLSSDSNVLSENLNSIIKNVKATSFLTSNVSGKSYESTTGVPSRIPLVIQKFFSKNASFLVKLSEEIGQLYNIGQSFDVLDRNLNNSAASSSLGIVVSNETNTPNVQDEDTDKLDENEEKGPQNEDVNKLDEVKYNKPQNTQHEDTDKLDENEEKGSQNEDVNKLDEVKYNKPQNTQPTYPDKSTGINNNDSGSSDGASRVESDNSNVIDDFPKYEELYSDDNKIVYNYNDEYKIIIHKDGDKIIGIEHYYNFGTEEEADKALNMLKAKYSSDEYLDNIIQKGHNVKVIFNEKMYHNLSIDDIKIKYSSLSEIIKL